MKLFIILFFLIAILASPVIAQTDPCENEKPLKIKVFDRFGFEKTTNFCQGEEVIFKIDGNFDRYIWGINNDNSDLNRAYFYEPNFKIKLPSNQAHITISAFKKGEGCYAKGSKLLTNFITTQRNLIITDSAFVGEDFVISTNYHIPGDILYTPYDTVFNFSGFRNENFQANKAGVYRLVNEGINNSCGNQDIEKTVYLTNNKAPTVIEISASTNLNFCEGWLLELGLKPINLKIKNPQYIVYLSNSPTIIKDSYYEQMAAINTQNGLIVKPDYKLGGRYLFVREQLSGVYSNVIGPFNTVEKTKATKENLEIIQYPQTILNDGDSTSFQIKTNLNTKVYWMDQGNIINQQTEKLVIKDNGYFWPVFIYEGDCVNFGTNYKAVYVTDFQSIVPFISVSKSCDKRSFIKLDLGVGQWNDDKVNSKLKIRWFRNEKLLQETQDLEFIATELGKYSCEIWNGNQFIESNVLQVNDFNGFIPNVYVNGYPIVNNTCAMAELLTETFTNAYSYSINNKQIKPTDSIYTFNWFLDNELQVSHLPKLNLPKDKDEFFINLMVNDGICNYISKPQIIKTKNIVTNFFNSKYEFCEGSLGEIYAPFYENVYTGNGTAIYNWYKDGQLFQSQKADFNASFMDINLKTKESGVYYLTTIFLKDSCTIKSKPFEIVFKKNITINSDQYLKRLCPTDPLLGLKLPRTDFEKIEWFYNNNLVTDQALNYSKNRDSTYLQLNTPGQYFAKVSYPNECTATSEMLDFDGTNDFDIFKSTTNEVLCKDDYLEGGKFYELNRLPFDFTWELDGNYFSSNYRIKPTKSGTYSVQAKHIEGNCTLNSKPLKVNIIKPNFSLTAQDSAGYCLGSALKVGLVDTTSQVLSWFKNNGATIPSHNNIEINEEGKFTALFYYPQCPSDYYFSNSLKVNELAKASASISGSTIIDYGKTTDLKIDLSSSPPWQVKLNTGEEFTIEKSPHTLTVRPLTDINYTLASVKNICGLGTTSGEALVKILVLGDEAERVGEPQIKVFPIPVSDIFELAILDYDVPIAEISLTNMLGIELQKHILFSKNKEFNKSLNISTLPAGMYSLKIKLGQKIITKKIIKK